MKTTINVTNECQQAIRSAATGNEFKNNGTQRADGTWDIPVDEEVVDRLKEVAFPGETYSDTIIRLAAFERSGGKLG